MMFIDLEIRKNISNLSQQRGARHNGHCTVVTSENYDEIEEICLTCLPADGSFNEHKDISYYQPFHICLLSSKNVPSSLLLLLRLGVTYRRVPDGLIGFV
jgi:hypothetical protein